MGSDSFPYHFVNNKFMEARFLFLMAIEMAFLDERIAGSEIQAGPKDIQCLPPYEHAIRIEYIPDILTLIRAWLIGHNENPPLIVGEKLVQRRKRIWEIFVLRRPRPPIIGPENGFFDLFRHPDRPVFLPDLPDEISVEVIDPELVSPGFVGHDDPIS